MRCSSRTRDPSRDERGLEREQLADGHVAVVHEHDGRGSRHPRRSATRSTMPLEADREADRGHVLAEEAADHAVVAAAAAERVVDATGGRARRSCRCSSPCRAPGTGRTRAGCRSTASSRACASPRPPRRCRPGARRRRRARPRAAPCGSGARRTGCTRASSGGAGTPRARRPRPAVAPRSRSSATTPVGPILSSLSIVMSTPGRSSAREAEARRASSRARDGR